jgi:integrase
MLWLPADDCALSRPLRQDSTAVAINRRICGVKARFHDMRHTAVTNLLGGGAPDETVMQIAGHISQMLSNYFHLRMQSKKKAIQPLDRKRGSHAA